MTPNLREIIIHSDDLPLEYFNSLCKHSNKLKGLSLLGHSEASDNVNLWSHISKITTIEYIVLDIRLCLLPDTKDNIMSMSSYIKNMRIVRALQVHQDMALEDLEQTFVYL